MDISPKENGIHSLAEALKSFKKFDDNNNDIFALKDSILRTHHALETLFKDILLKTNPVFLIEKKINVDDIIKNYISFLSGEYATPLGNEFTIGLEKAVNRLFNLRIFKKPEKKDFNIFISKG